MANPTGKGGWVKGKSGNPNGRAKKEREARYLDIMLSVVDPVEWKAICAKAAEQAKKGDGMARKWLADYLIGPPVQKQEVTGADSGPLKIQVVYDDYPNQDAETAPGPG